MNAILNIVAFGCLGLSLWAGYEEKVSLTTVSFFSFFFLLFIANISKFSEFKAGLSGFEAKTAKIIGEAESAIVELRSLAKIVAGTNLSLVIRNGRMGGYTDTEQEDYLNSTLKVLKEIGVPSEEYCEVLTDWHRMIELDYVRAIITVLNKYCAKNNLNTPELSKEADELNCYERKATPSDIATFLASHRISDHELNELLADFQYYHENRKHRRPSIWASRKEWLR